MNVPWLYNIVIPRFESVLGKILVLGNYTFDCNGGSDLYNRIYNSKGNLIETNNWETIKDITIIFVHRNCVLNI